MTYEQGLNVMFDTCIAQMQISDIDAFINVINDYIRCIQLIDMQYEAKIESANGNDKREFCRLCDEIAKERLENYTFEINRVHNEMIEILKKAGKLKDDLRVKELEDKLTRIHEITKEN